MKKIWFKISNEFSANNFVNKIVIRPKSELLIFLENLLREDKI